MSEANNPLVSVCCITYNHGQYISQSIEGFLIQKTNFPFEIIIGEDKSQDDTHDICLRYAACYPSRIRLLHREHNLGMLPNFFETLKSCNGKYIALCEGDDYWIDPYKLQKQVDFLEANSEYGLVHTDCDFLYESGQILHCANKSKSVKTNYEDREDLFDSLIDASYKIRTATILFRKSTYDIAREQLGSDSTLFLMGDTPMWLEMSRVTLFYYIDEVTAVYRISSETASRSTNKAKQLRFRLSMAEMRVYFVKKYKLSIPEHLRRRYNSALLLYKTVEPTYGEMYPLIEPRLAERFLYNLIRQASSRLVVQFWFRAQSLIARVVIWLRKEMCRLWWRR